MLYETLALWLPTVFNLLLITFYFYLIYRLSNEYSNHIDKMRSDELSYGKVLQATIKRYNVTKWLFIIVVIFAAIKIHNFHL